MLALAGLLFSGAVRDITVRPAASLLLRHMGLFFVPPAVAAIDREELRGTTGTIIVVASVASMIAVMLVVGVVASRAERR
jgi:putative effector of murein hydrolase LrgA (UPF0299 family)